MFLSSSSSSSSFFPNRVLLIFSSRGRSGVGAGWPIDPSSNGLGWSRLGFGSPKKVFRLVLL